jgi:hypothetical protein
MIASSETANNGGGSVQSNRLNDRADLQFDEECDKNGEWESLGRHYYFKRTAGFYFTDACLLRLNFVADHSITQARFSLDLTIGYNRSTSTTVRLSGYKVVQLSIQRMVNEYNLMQMDAYVNASQLLQGKFDGSLRPVHVDLKSLEITVHVSEYFANATTKRGMKVVVKQLRNDYDNDHDETNLVNNKNLKKIKKTALICGKCFRLTKTAQNGRLLKWWLDLNRKVGYDNIVLCNHSIEIDRRFLFRNYKDFLILNKVSLLLLFLGGNQNIEKRNIYSGGLKKR